MFFTRHISGLYCPDPSYTSYKDEMRVSAYFIIIFLRIGCLISDCASREIIITYIISATILDH